MADAAAQVTPLDLSGVGVLVTRPAHQASSLCRAIRAAGGRALEFPALEIVPVGDPGTLGSLFDRLFAFHLLIFISANAVTHGAPWIRRAGGLPSGVRLAAVGRATARALERELAPPDLVPDSGFDSESLLLSPELQEMVGQRVLIVRGEGGRPFLAEELGRRGAAVTYAEVYRRRCPQLDPAPLLARWGDVDLVIATSQELLDNLLRLFGDRGGRLLRARPLLVISPRLAEYARSRGFERVLQAREAGDPALLEALAAFAAGGPERPGGG